MRRTVVESLSGDDLIVVSFGQRDCDLLEGISRVRSKNSPCGELEFDLAASIGQRESLTLGLARHRTPTHAPSPTQAF